MKIKIKNTTGERRKVVLFGHYDDCWEGKRGYVPQPSFFNFNTDEGIEIEFDGNSSLEYRRDCVKHINKIVHLKSVEYTSNFGWDKIKLGNFKLLQIDANGQHNIADICLQMFFTPQQETEYPIIITEGKHGEGIRGIDCNTSLLFILEPTEEITLKLNDGDQSTAIDRWAKNGAFDDKPKPKK